MADDERIEALQRELAELKRSMPPSADERAAMERAVAEGRDRAHQMREAQMAYAAPFTRQDLAAFEAACPTAAVKDIVRKGGMRPPSADGTTGTISAVRGPSGVYPNTGGWRPETPFGAQPGINHVDRIAGAFAERDKVEAVAQEARRMAMLKLAEPK
jgi:hypothetical protein